MMRVMPLLFLLACGDDDERIVDAAPDARIIDAAQVDAGPADARPDAPPPKMPAVGMQIDRAGRPEINALLNHPFTTDRDRAANAYDAEGDRANWVTNWSSEFSSNLAILDGMNGVCGDQIQADVESPRYANLGKVLADDRLYLDSRVGTCTKFFAVETGDATDCGGRTPTSDAVDALFSIFAGASVTDGVDHDDSTPSGDFPFFAEP